MLVAADLQVNTTFMLDALFVSVSYLNVFFLVLLFWQGIIVQFSHDHKILVENNRIVRGSTVADWYWGGFQVAL